MARELHKCLRVKAGVPVITWLITHLQVLKLFYECQDINKQKVKTVWGHFLWVAWAGRWDSRLLFCLIFSGGFILSRGRSGLVRHSWQLFLKTPHNQQGRMLLLFEKTKPQKTNLPLSSWVPNFLPGISISSSLQPAWLPYHFRAVWNTPLPQSGCPVSQ